MVYEPQQWFRENAPALEDKVFRRDPDEELSELQMCRYARKNGIPEEYLDPLPLKAWLAVCSTIFVWNTNHDIPAVVSKGTEQFQEYDWIAKCHSIPSLEQEIEKYGIVYMFCACVLYALVFTVRKEPKLIITNMSDVIWAEVQEKCPIGLRCIAIDINVHHGWRFYRFAIYIYCRIKACSASTSRKWPGMLTYFKWTLLCVVSFTAADDKDMFALLREKFMNK